MSKKIFDQIATIVELYALCEEAGLTCGATDAAREVSYAIEDLAGYPLQPSEVAAVRRLVTAVIFRMMPHASPLGWDSVARVSREFLARAEAHGMIVDPNERFELAPDEQS